MSEMHALNETAMTSQGRLTGPDGDLLARVLSVLQGIRPRQSNGLAYQATSNLTDAGFTSVEMVKVMLGIEAAFDVMIPFRETRNYVSKIRQEAGARPAPTRIYRVVELKDGREVVRYTNTPPK